MRRKRARKGEKARKVTERKMGNMHLLEARLTLKDAGKRAEKDRKRREKGRKKGEKGEKGTERKMGNMHLLNNCQLGLNGA
jgi:hypothetical protein